MSRLALRRSLITLVTIVSVFGGAVAIRAAAGWTAGAAPLNQPPDAAALVGKLRDEKARADAMAAELHQVLDRSAQLQDALRLAQQMAVSEAASADQLAGQLAAAEARLAALQRQLASSPAAGGGTTATAASTAPTATGGTEPGDD
jgi:chromosome segregation ATPase